MNMTRFFSTATALFAVPILTATATATPQTTTLQVIDDFDVSVVFRPIFPGLNDRNAIIDQARFQVNGDETGTTGTLGQFVVFDIDGSSVRPESGAAFVDNITFDLFPAVNQDTGSGGITSAGDLSIYFTTSDVDVLDPDSGIIFDNGGGTDPTGLGDQFENLSLLSSGFQDEGIYDISRSLDLDSIQSELLSRINDGQNLRFILASQTPGFTSNFATGNEDPSDFFDFFGDPSLVNFSVTALPSPGALALFAFALVAPRRRR
jgi:hypothetical protein